MKKISLFIAAFILLIAACKKKSDPAINYTVNGLTDVSVQQYHDTTFSVVVAVAFVSGTQEPVTLTPGGLPAGVSVTPTTFTGTPGFGATFTFHSNATASGTFPITITSSAAGTDNKDLKFNLIVSPGTQFTYSVSSLPDITVPQYSHMTSNVPVTVTYGQGTSELVKLYGSSLPAKVTIDTTSGTPTFSSAIPVHIALSTPGTYPVTVNSSSPSTATQSSSFNIIVTPNANCESAIAGTYTATTNCSAVITSYWTGPSPHSVTVTSTGITNQVVMPGLISNISANLICSTGTLTTLERNNGDIDLKAGTGIFSADSMHITYDVYALGGPYLATCTTSYVR